MAALEAYGRSAFLIVPNDHHRLDAKAWKDRYPAMQVVAPEGSRAKVEKAVPVDTASPRFDDPSVQFVAVPGTRGREAALVVRTPKGTTLVLNDLVGNIRNESGFGGWLLHMAGFAGKEAQIPRVVKMAMIEDTNALRAQLLQCRDRVAQAHPRVARFDDRREPAPDVARPGKLAGVRQEGASARCGRDELDKVAQQNQKPPGG